MKENVCTYYYSPPAGKIRITAKDGSITSLKFVKKNEKTDSDANVCLDRDGEHSGNAAALAQVIKWLDIYFSGKKPNFFPPLKVEGTDFQKKIWQITTQIPFGKTASYSFIAKKCGCRYARAIGFAMNVNPVQLIVPCHRVIGSDGKLVGYAGGLEIKKWLLQFEELHFSEK